MRFWLIDAIQSYEPGVQLTAVKNVALTEEYLADHFPEFPVLPGVFMLEAAVQASAWLLRLSENYAHSIIRLKEVSNVKYADFVPPGSTLSVYTTVIKSEGQSATFKVTGRVGDRLSLTGRLVVERFNLRERDPAKAEIDEQIISRFRLAEQVLIGSRPRAAMV
jgi:3-hydroxyacyl-[acyl-carrier-protein] dehydratase